MARPRKSGLDYFPHDTDASSKEHMEVLRSLYGNDGYAFYFILKERICAADNCELLLNVSDAETTSETISVLAGKVRVPIEKFSQMLKTALKHGCFDKKSYEERGVLTMDDIKQTKDMVITKREKSRKYYEEKKKRKDYNKKKGRVSVVETLPEKEKRKNIVINKREKSRKEYEEKEKRKDCKEKGERVSVAETPQSKAKQSKAKQIIQENINNNHHNNNHPPQMSLLNLVDIASASQLSGDLSAYMGRKTLSEEPPPPVKPPVKEEGPK